MNLEEQLKAMRVGARVRAPGGIYYANTGRDVPAGACGNIRGVSHGGGIVAILWDGDAEAIWTGFTSIEVLGPAPAEGSG